MQDKRIAELEEWERETGRSLPFTPVQILRLEDRGHVVNLETGEVTYNAADREAYYRLALLLREAGLWDGVSELQIEDAPRVWAALNAGELHVQELVPGVHFRLEPALRAAPLGQPVGFESLTLEQLTQAVAILQGVLRRLRAGQPVQATQEALS